MEKQFEFLMYQSSEEDVFVNALVQDETIWLTQKGMSELFCVDKSTISRHLKNIFAKGELNESVVVAKIATTTQHGAIEGKNQSNLTQFYNMEIDNLMPLISRFGDRNLQLLCSSLFWKWEYRHQVR